MTKPLAVLCYEKLLPGSQLVNGLEKLAYRVEVLNDAERLPETVRRLRPMLALVDMASSRTDVAAQIKALRDAEETSHLPILAFAGQNDETARNSAREAGADLAANEALLLEQLPSLLNQILELHQ